MSFVLFISLIFYSLHYVIFMNTSFLLNHINEGDSNAHEISDTIFPGLSNMTEYNMPFLFLPIFFVTLLYWFSTFLVFFFSEGFRKIAQADLRFIVCLASCVL